MTHLVYAFVIIMAVRCVSFGIFELKRRNISGGIACFVLAVLSLVSALAVFY